jgi:hypothetical protein
LANKLAKFWVGRAVVQGTVPKIYISDYIEISTTYENNNLGHTKTKFVLARKIPFHSSNISLVRSWDDFSSPLVVRRGALVHVTKVMFVTKSPRSSSPQAKISALIK